MKSLSCIILFQILSLVTSSQTVLKKVVISNGGSWTANALYQANLTIGQSITMKTESENSEACIGFWYEIKDVPLVKTKLEKYNFPQSIQRTQRNTISELKVYPNPMFDHTQIEFEIAESGMVRLCLVDMQGREVGVIFQENLKEGKYRVRYGLGEKIAGMYTVLLSQNGERMDKKILIAR